MIDIIRSYQSLFHAAVLSAIVNLLEVPPEKRIELIKLGEKYYLDEKKLRDLVREAIYGEFGFPRKGKIGVILEYGSHLRDSLRIPPFELSKENDNVKEALELRGVDPEKVFIADENRYWYITGLKIYDRGIRTRFPDEHNITEVTHARNRLIARSVRKIIEKEKQLNEFVVFVGASHARGVVQHLTEQFEKHPELEARIKIYTHPASSSEEIERILVGLLAKALTKKFREHLLRH